MEFSFNNGQKHEFQMRKRALLFFITLKSLQKGKKNGTCLFKGCDIYGRKVEFVLLGWLGQKQNGGERLYLVRNKIKLSRKRQKSNCNKSKYKFYKCGVI